MNGATDTEACPTRFRNRGPASAECRCLPPCVICGYGEHAAIHGPLFGQPPGSKPWGHEFKPEDSAK